MRAIESKISGCYELIYDRHKDNRGALVKTYQDSVFSELGLNSKFKESYYSQSSKGVLRGLHFQLPPSDHDKLVYCSSGNVWDVVVDLRPASDTLGDWSSIELSEESNNAIYVPAGLAHGFYTLSEVATLTYLVTSEYAPELDTGILWDSCNIDWPSGEKILSERDQNFKPLSQFSWPDD